MTNFQKSAALLVVAGATLAGGCSLWPSYHNVPPNYLGMVLTPTGYDPMLYTPGQVNLGAVGMSGAQNKLVLIQRSGLHIKEAFVGEGGNGDKEDHRALTRDSRPVTIDVRILLALPDHTTAEGKAALSRIFLLGNPQPTSSGRVLRLRAESVYEEQVRLQVRGNIRKVVARFADYQALFTAFGTEGPQNLSAIIENTVRDVLRKHQVPFGVVSVEVSNLKPDPSVIAAEAAIQSARARIEAIRTIGQFLRENPDMREVYKYQALAELLSQAAKGGQHTMLLTDLPSLSGAPLPLPVKSPAK